MTINANAHKHRHTQWRLGGSVRANSVLYACYNIVANGRQKRKERKKDVPFIQLLLELMYCLHLALPLSLCVTTSMASPSFCKPTRHRKSPCIWFLAKRKKRRFCIKKSGWRTKQRNRRREHRKRRRRRRRKQSGKRLDDVHDKRHQLTHTFIEGWINATASYLRSKWNVHDFDKHGRMVWV